MQVKTPLHIQQSPRYYFLGVLMTIHLSGAQTGGEFSLIEAVMPPGGDGGLHAHTREDESVHLVEGELEVTIGDETFILRPGESYFAPRGVPHRLRNHSVTPARAFLMNTPGSFDGFIRIAGTLADGSSEPPVLNDAGYFLRLQELAGQWGIKILIPPDLTMQERNGNIPPLC
jgi:mannose-6-phosphate isomerase-like protein (cupin superfamily)